MRTKQDLITMLSAYCDVVDDHITSKQQVKLPYIVILEDDSNNKYADNTTFCEYIPYTFVLHQAKRDNELETNVKNVLTTNHIPYATESPEWDEVYCIYAQNFNITL